MAEPSRFTTYQLALNGNLRVVVNNWGRGRKIFVRALCACPLLLQILDPPLVILVEEDKALSAPV